MKHNHRTQDNWTTNLLAFLLVVLVALTIGHADLVRSVNMVQTLLIITFFGFLAGMALAKSRFPSLTSHIYSLVYGAFLVTFLIGRTLPENLLWRERVADLITRQADWFTRLFEGGTSRDGLVFVMHTSVVMWLLAYTAAWYSTRKIKVWRVVVPSGIVLISVIYYLTHIFRMRAYLALYCLAALLFIAQTFLAQNKLEWRYRLVRFDKSITGTFLRSSVVIALLALTVSWSLPALSASTEVGDTINRVNEPWRNFRNNWQRMFSALNSQGGVSADPYSETLTLGGPRNVGDQPIMDIYVDEELPYAYWRSTVLDRYEDGEWWVAPGDTIEHFPDEPPIDIPDYEEREIVSQSIVNYIPNAGTIFALPEIVNSDRQILLKNSFDPRGKQQISASRSRYFLQLGDRYQVTSELSVATQTQLRGVSAEYPNYIVEQYLALPNDVTDRTLELAVSITAQYDTPYDKALAVQNYLRRNITYNDQIEAPPQNVDPVDYVLFESREGYCNYYASAMAVMLRSQGIPTRLARGYASGEFNKDTSRYRVRAQDAHVWVEVYFNEFGWIQFEPTAIISTVDRPIGEEDVGPEPGTEEAAAEQDPLLDDEVPQEEPLTPEELDEQLGNEADDPAAAELGGAILTRANIFRVLGAVALISLAALAILMADRFNRRVEGDIDGSYGRLAFWGRFMGLPMQPAQTPFERAELLSSAAPDGEQPIRTMIDEFVRRKFSQDKKDNYALNLLSEWKTLRPVLLKQGIRNRLPSWMSRTEN